MARDTLYKDYIKSDLLYNWIDILYMYVCVCVLETGDFVAIIFPANFNPFLLHITSCNSEEENYIEKIVIWCYLVTAHAQFRASRMKLLE